MGAKKSNTIFARPIKEAVNRLERTMIRQRIKAGLKRAVAQGVKLGRPKIDSATERKVRKQLGKGMGILKVATPSIRNVLYPHAKQCASIEVPKLVLND